MDRGSHPARRVARGHAAAVGARAERGVRRERQYGGAHVRVVV